MTEKPIFNQITIRNTHNSPIKKICFVPICSRRRPQQQEQLPPRHQQRGASSCRLSSCSGVHCWRAHMPFENPRVGSDCGSRDETMHKCRRTPTHPSTTTVGKEKVCKTRGWCRWYGSCPTASGSNDSLRVSCRPWFTFLHLTHFFGRWSQADLRQR